MLPLRGKTVVITRPREQAEELAQLVAGRGGKPLIASTVEIKPHRDPEAVRQLIRSITSGRVDYLVFMSRNGVASLIEASKAEGLRDDLMRALNRAKIVAVGPKTRKKIEDYGLKVDFTPSEYSSTGLLRLLSKMGIQGKSVMIPRAEKASGYLREGLQKLGADVMEFPVYESALPSNRYEVLGMLDELFRGEVDVVTFTSSATARNLFKIAQECGKTDELRTCLGYLVVAAIGPVTQKTLEEHGVRVHVTPKEYTVDAMIAAVENHLEEEGQPTASAGLDDIDLRLLRILQDEFPLTGRPWAEIGRRLNLDEGEVMKRSERLLQEGVIQRIGPVLDSRRMGLSGFTLIAMRIPKDRVDEVSKIINEFASVSHNYLREYDYNIWFTISALSQDGVEKTLQEIKRRSRVKDDDVLDLPTEHLFKVDARLQLR